MSLYYLSKAYITNIISYYNNYANYTTSTNTNDGADKKNQNYQI